MPVKQVHPWSMFPSGDSLPLVELRFNPDELTTRYGLQFSQEFDDLNDFKLAAIALPDGSQAWLYKYRGEQEAGTGVRIDVAADFARAKDSLLTTLNLTDDDLLWVSPFVAHPEQKPAPPRQQRAR